MKIEVIEEGRITKEEREKIHKVFEEEFEGNGMYDIWTVDASETTGPVDIVCIEIDGDWKHAHRYADSLMERLGYALKFIQTLEEDGSDWYKAIRNYVKDVVKDEIV